MPYQSPWPGVKRQKSAGKFYFYWTVSDPWVRLPNPYDQPDAFMRKIAHLKRTGARAQERTKWGTLPACIIQYRTWLESSSRAGSTKETYGTYLDQLETMFADAPIKDVRKEDIQERVMDANRHRPGAANMLLRVLHNVYLYAGERVPKLDDPTEKIRSFPALREYEPWPKAVIDAALASNDLLFRRAVALHLFTGQRTGDSCRMLRASIAADRIPVKQEKTGIELSIPLHPKLRAAIDAGPAKAPTILENSGGRPLQPQLFRIWCDSFGEMHGIKLVPHGLRKNAVNALLEAGCTVFETHSITGQSLQMVEHYAKRVNRSKGADAAMAKWAGTSAEREKDSATGKRAE